MSMYSRGGIWTNVEDEILKAAVAKYGLTQWSRCSSLLNRKTAKQCKSRWLNWLSPRVNKSEWSTKEEEKLLSLAKVLPNQWQTIAPIIGRTPNQCIERYQKLLDDVNFGDGEASGFDSDKTKAALLKTNSQAMPESMAARPDAIEMDDEEREMISEARARLANTQGKKAKRKNRERMLAQSRRVALLQKRRELKNVGMGINTTTISKKKKNTNEMDYNQDIAFEVKPNDNLYDTSNEDKKDLQALETFRNSLQKKRKFSKDEDEKKEKKHDKKRKQNTKQESTQSDEQILEDSDLSIVHKLILSKPKENQAPIDQLVRQYLQQSGISFDEVKSMIIKDENEYLRTKLLESQDERLQRFGKELIKFSNLENALFEARKIEEEGNQEAREMENINDIQKQSIMVVKEDKKPLKIKKSIKKLSSILRQRFMNLPTPKNEFEIVVEDDDEEYQNQEKKENVVIAIEKKSSKVDKGKLAEQAKLQKEKELQKRLDSRSLAIRKHLPIPVIEKPKQIIEQLLKYSIVNDVKLQQLLDKEMVKLIISDYLKMEYNEKSLKGYDNLAFSALLNDEAFTDDVIRDLEPDIRDNILKRIEEEQSENKMIDINSKIVKVTNKYRLTEEDKFALIGKFLVGDTLKKK